MPATVGLPEPDTVTGIRSNMNWREYISVDPMVCHGKACVKGTRVLVSVILDNLAAGMTHEDIVRSYPTISTDAVRAALAYAADLAGERIVAATDT